MRHSSLLNTSKDGFPHDPPILIPNMQFTSLRNQIAELRQRLGDEPAEVTNPPCTGQQSSSSQSTPIQRALMGNSAPPAPPSFFLIQLAYSPFQPRRILGLRRTCLLAWLIIPMPNGSRTFPLSDVQRNVLTTNITKTETWWAEALETVQKVAVMSIPVTMLNKNFNATNLMKILTAAISMTN